MRTTFLYLVCTCYLFLYRVTRHFFFILRIFRFSSDLAYPPLNFGNWVHIRVHCKCFKNFLASYKLCTTFTEINNTKRLNPKSLRKDWWKYIPSITSNSRTFIKMLKKKVEIEIGYIMYIKQMQISKHLMVAKAIFYF